MLVNPLSLIDLTRVNKYWQLYITGIAIIISQFLYRVSVINNKSSGSHVSVISGLNFWFWIFSTILVLIVVLKLKEASIESIGYFILHSALGIIVGFNISGALLSLSGTPLTFGDIRGDLGAFVGLAENAKQTGFSGIYYPPVYVSIIGNISSLFNLQPIWMFKYFDILILLISPIILKFQYSKFLPNSITLIFVLALNLRSNLDWKNLAFYLFLGQILLIYKNKKVIDSKKDIIINYFNGIILGTIVLTYFGHLWWSMLAVFIFSLVIIFKGKKYYLNQFSIYLGFFLVMGPFFLQQKLGINALYILILGLILCLVNLFFTLPSRISAYLIPLVILSILISFRTNDTWVEGNIQSQNPTVNLFGDLDFSNTFLITFILALIYFYKQEKFQIYRYIPFYIVSLILSAMTMMYYFASRMQVTEKIELWPRAYGSVLNLFAFVVIIVFTFVTFELFEKYIDVLQLKKFIIIVFVVLLFPASQSINSKIFSLFPTFSNGA